MVIGEIIGQKAGDIEDLFAPVDYLEIFNRALNQSIQPSTLNSTEPIVSQLAKILGVDRYDHGRPADVLLKDRDVLLPKFQASTFMNFEALFEKINQTLGT